MSSPYSFPLLLSDAEWFDKNNRDELPTKCANSMIHITGAIGRQMADLFANMWSSAGCLAVAFVLNAPLALIMLLIVPVVVICIAILSCFIRKSSKESGHSFGLAGALATEVLAGIKTVASLCAEPWAITTYGEHVIEAQKSSVWAGFLTALSTGITSLLFYITYTFAFFIGTQQVVNNSSMVQFFVCLIGPWVADLDIQIPPWWGIIGGGIIGGIGGGGGIGSSGGGIGGGRGDDSMRFLQTSNATTTTTNSTEAEIGIGDIIDAIQGIGELYDPEVCRITGASIMCCIYGGKSSQLVFALFRVPRYPYIEFCLAIPNLNNFQPFHSLLHPQSFFAQHFSDLWRRLFRLSISGGKLLWTFLTRSHMSPALTQVLVEGLYPKL